MSKNKNKGINWAKYLVALIVIIALGLGSKFTGDDTSDTTNSSSENAQESVVELKETDEGDTEVTESDDTFASEDDYVEYKFRKQSLLDSHYEKHGEEMGYASAEEYEKAASDVVNNKECLHKTEAEDGDDIYYLESENYFVVVSTDGYIRTFFQPDSGIKYYNKQ